MTTMSPLLPGPTLPYGKDALPQGISNRYSGSHLSSFSSPPLQGRSSPPTPSSIQLPPLRSLQSLPPISTFHQTQSTSLPIRPPAYESRSYSSSSTVSLPGSRSPYQSSSRGSPTSRSPSSLEPYLQPYGPPPSLTASLPSPTSESHRPMNRKGPWTKNEDDMLKFFVQQQQISNPGSSTHWGDVSKAMGEQRTAKQCRERYTQNLAPGLNRGPITSHEADFILSWVSKNGTQWAELSRQPEVKGRSDNHLKNWWNGQKKQLDERERAAKKQFLRRSSHQKSAPSSPSPPPAASGQMPLPQFGSNGSSSSSSRMTIDSLVN